MGRLIPLDASHTAAAEAFLAAEPIENALLRGHLRAHGLADAGEFGPQAAAYEEDGRWLGLAARCDGSLLFYMPDPRAIDALAEWMLPHLAMTPHLTGKAEVIDAMADMLAIMPWDLSFDHRQVVLTMRPGDLIDTPPDPAVRRARPDEALEVARLVSAMHLEEVHQDPLARLGDAFVELTAHEITRGRYFVLEDEGRLVYVVRLTGVTPEAGLMVEVYTPPEHRRRGYARRGLSTACRLAFEQTACLITVVNDFNRAALALNTGLGFQRTDLGVRALMWQA